MSLYPLLALVSALLATVFYFTARKGKTKQFSAAKKSTKRSNPITGGLFVLSLLGAAAIVFVTFASPEVDATVTVEENDEPREVVAVEDDATDKDELAAFSYP